MSQEKVSTGSHASWHNYVVDGVEPEVSGRHNLDVLRVTDAIIRSTETGRARIFGR